MEIYSLPLLLCVCLRWTVLDAFLADKLSPPAASQDNSISDGQATPVDKHDTMLSDQPTGLAKKYNSSCCQNGGKCILGSFCHCPKNFFGRFCEHEYTKKPCGIVEHGSWIVSDCNLCRCFNGYFMCVPKVFHGCDEKGPFDPHQKVEPMKGKDIEIIRDNIDEDEKKALNLRTEDYEYADYYDDEADNTINSGATSTCGSWWTSPLLFLLVILS